MTKKKIILIHIFIWLFALVVNLPYSGVWDEMRPEYVASNIIGFLYLMLVFYLFYSILVPGYIDRRKISLFFAVSFFSVLVLPFFGYTLLFTARALFDGTFRDFFRGYSFRMHMSGYYPVLTAAVFGSFFRLIVNWIRALNQKAESDRQRLAIELDLVKSRLNPHFLFNTLNNIDSLIHNEPEAASSALIKLSEVMRYLTYETKPEAVELGKEIDYINNLLELYRIRVNKRDSIRFSVKADTGLPVSPALFIPLIENAFKFATYNDGRPAVDISLSSDNGIIIFVISNFYDRNKIAETNDNSGTGLANLEKRLKLVYPDRHELRIEKDEKQYKAKLTIDTKNANQLYSHRR